MSELPIVRDLTLECGPTMRTGKLAADLIRELVEALEPFSGEIMNMILRGNEGKKDEWLVTGNWHSDITWGHLRAVSAVLAKAKQPIGGRDG